MNKILLIFVFILCLKTFGQNKASRENALKVDTSKITILSSKIILKYIFNKNCTEAKLNNNEALTIDLLLRKCIDKYNIEAEKEFRQIILDSPSFKPNKENFVINIEKYKRQYIVITNSKGEKEVWINCLCSLKKDWRKKLIMVDDGGNCYFNLKINLTKKIYYALHVNGEA